MANDEKHYTVWSNGQKIGDVYKERDYSDSVKDRKADMMISIYENMLGIDRDFEEKQIMLNSLSIEDKKLMDEETQQIAQKIEELKDKLKANEKKCSTLQTILFWILIVPLYSLFIWLSDFKVDFSRIGEMNIFSWALFLFLCFLPIYIAIFSAVILSRILFLLPDAKTNKQIKELEMYKEGLLKKYFMEKHSIQANTKISK